MTLRRAYSDDEQDIVDDAAQIDDADVCFYPAKSELAYRFLAALRAGGFGKRERPDFEDHGASLLLEAMIVDDHPRLGKKDQTRMNEGEVFRQLKAAGLNLSPGVKVMTTISSGLPTEQDHNYKAYVEHFQTIVMKHARNAEVYRAEQPDYDLGFLIFDESTAYFESKGQDGSAFVGRPHFWFADAAFTEVMEKSGADCFVWMTPYKMLLQAEAGAFALPRMTIVDVPLLQQLEHLKYDEQRMISSEE